MSRRSYLSIGAPAIPSRDSRITWSTTKRWLTADENHKLIDEVERELEAEREAAVASPMPDPETDKTHQGVYCDASCHEIKPLYGPVKAAVRENQPRQLPKQVSQRCI